MSHADSERNKVLSWSLSLNMSSGETVEAVNLPSFTVAAIDDYCTEIDEGKIHTNEYKMKMTPSGYYYNPDVGTSESVAAQEALGSGIGFKDLPMSTPGSFSTTTDNAFEVEDYSSIEESITDEELEALRKNMAPPPTHSITEDDGYTD